MIPRYVTSLTTTIPSIMIIREPMTWSWYENLKKSEKIWLWEYFGKPLSKNKMLDTIIITLQQSVAPTVIFPLQDIQHLPSSARINTPGTTANNWVWRSRRNRLTKEEEQKLLNITRRYNRI
jgi:4-alpha-glucanotransferase